MKHILNIILQKRKTSTKSYPPDLSALQMLLEREGNNEFYIMTDEQLEKEKQRLLSKLKEKK